MLLLQAVYCDYDVIVCIYILLLQAKYTMRRHCIDLVTEIKVYQDYDIIV